MSPRETEINAYAKFWGDKQRALWYVMVFSGVVNLKTCSSRRMPSHIREFNRLEPHSSHEAHVHPRCIARPVLQKKTFRVVENRCLQCVESIFVNLPQFAKFGLKESLNRFFCFCFFVLFFFFSSFWIFWNGFEPFCFCECLFQFHCSTFDGGAIETYG